MKDGKFTLYDMYLLKNSGVEVWPDGTFTVSIPVPDGYDGTPCKVYRANEDGSVTEITASLKDGKLVFETDKVGAFAVWQPVTVDENDPGSGDGNTGSPETGDSTPCLLYTSALKTTTSKRSTAARPLISSM